MSVLARLCGPAAIFDWCDFSSKTFDLSGFLPLSATTNLNGGSTPHGADGCIIILAFTSLTLKTFVGCNKTYWT